MVLEFSGLVEVEIYMIISKREGFFMGIVFGCMEGGGRFIVNLFMD